MAAKLKLSNTGFKRLRSSPEMQSFLRKKANAIAAAAQSTGETVVDGEHGHYGVDSVMGKSRARARVYTMNTAARLDQATNSTLTKSVGAGRS